jgi:ribonuclease D
MAEFAHEHSVPVENVLSPDSLRRVLWTPPEPATEASLREALTTLGARRWQCDIAVPIIEAAIAAHPRDDDAEDDDA